MCGFFHSQRGSLFFQLEPHLFGLTFQNLPLSANQLTHTVSAQARNKRTIWVQIMIHISTCSKSLVIWILPLKKSVSIFSTSLELHISWDSSKIGRKIFEKNLAAGGLGVAWCRHDFQLQILAHTEANDVLHVTAADLGTSVLGLYPLVITGGFQKWSPKWILRNGKSY